MPLGQGIGEMWKAVRDRIEVDGHDPTWQVTAGSFDSALAASAPPLEQLAAPPSLLQEEHETVAELENSLPEQRADSPLPSSLEAIFAHQEELRLARQRVPAHDSHARVADSRSA